MSTAATLGALLGADPLDITAIEAHLNGLSEAGRVAAARGLKKRDMVKLWDAAAGRAVTAADYVPSSVADGIPIIHMGKNSLPVASNFQKRFVRPSGVAPDVVWGYNHNWFNFTTAGPGYFVASHDEAHGEYGLNYYDVPPKDAVLPASWPKVRKNEFGIQCLIYAKMIDYMRKLSEGVTIGRAWVKGKETGNYFVLARTGG